MIGRVILENGMIFEGKCFGKIKDTIGEVIFNTGMTGYQEILTDPSYCGQIVLMNYPLIGNYGINLDDSQSKSPKVKGFIVREKCDNPSNWRCEMNLDTYLSQNNIIGLEGIDTRELCKIVRTKGSMKGIITTRDIDDIELNEMFNNFTNHDAVDKVTRNEITKIEGAGIHLGVLDFGIKENILKSFNNRGCKITVFPAFTSESEILKHNVDGLFLSNGPGDPEDLTEVIETVKKLIFKIPVTGICLGHQIISLALGAKTKKMKFGHHGCNHPVKNMSTGRVTITSQNHGYVVNKDTLDDNIIVTHINMNDGSVEGLRHKTLPVMSVQYHPEACPGPYESDYIFDEFMDLYIEEVKNANK